MANFERAFGLAEEAIVFDNSRESHVKVAVKEVETVTLYEPLPEWAEFLRKAT